ncbi:hypothetical protein COTS27_00553 [Spirochaetota bacterium]|nr:hypothetical protein COTS27_00553 [Spirochaetota bacterium]
MKMKQCSLQALEEYLHATFNWEVHDQALNGIQIANERGVSKLGVGVDFCDDLISAAEKAGCDALLVHHGLYWGRVEALVARKYRLVKRMMANDTALIALHLPLDLHPVLGNNIGLIEALDLVHSGNFGDYKGNAILFEARIKRDSNRKSSNLEQKYASIDFKDLCTRYKSRIGSPLMTLQAHDRSVERIGICSGGGLFGVDMAYQHGCDTYITGDANHIAYHQAKELPINLICGGHYYTETFGVNRLAAALQKKFGLTYQFFDLPTHL